MKLCLSIWVALAFSATANPALSPQAPTVDPVIELTWDAKGPGKPPPPIRTPNPGANGIVPRVEDGLGVGGTACLVATGTGNGGQILHPLTMDASELESVLRGATALTITFWLKGRPDYTQPGHDVILQTPSLKLFLYRTSKEHPACTLAMDNGRSITLWATRHSEILNGDAWSFYAFTFDSTRSKDNCLSYSGSEEDTVRQVWAVSAGSGRAPRGCDRADAKLLLGASSPQGAEAFSGALDNLRIYASSDPGASAVLTLSELESVRLSDLGPRWGEVLRERREQRRADMRERQQRLESIYSDALVLRQTDSLTPVFPDRLPGVITSDTVYSAPRGGTAAVAFVLRAREETVCRLTLDGPVADAEPDRSLRADTRLFRVMYVPVEANNNGGSRSGVGRRPPDHWLRHCVREAPFDIGEVMIPVAAGDDVPLPAGQAALVIVDVRVPSRAEAGLYRGRLSARTGSRTVRQSFRMRVHDVTLREQDGIHVSYWLSPAPEDLTSGPVPTWWSARHWELLRRTGATLRRFDQDCIFTPVLKGKHALVDVVRTGEGAYEFEFTRFDRWVEEFLDLGFRQLHGHHLSQWGNVWGTDGGSAGRKLLVKTGDREAFADLTDAFLAALNRHLGQKGWKDYYAQHVIDECREPAAYRALVERVHRHSPGLRVIDAINSRPLELSRWVDDAVLSISLAQKHRDLSSQRRGSGLSTWYYNCCSPSPPFPNRHLDEPLTHSRLYPWYAYLFDLDGYLNWGGNIYRGADPYKTSVGPLPNGSQDPGHPPGDNWHYYPGPDGLLPGLRVLAFREGLTDLKVLKRLARLDKATADASMLSVARSLSSYTKQPEDFRRERKRMLAVLEKPPAER